MKILHVNKYLYRRGGAEAYALDLAELQRDAGHQIEFFGMSHPMNLPQTYQGTFPARIEFQPIPASLTSKARATGRMMYSVAARRGIDEVLRRFRPDVVHLHNIYHQLSPSILGPISRRGIPAVMTLHDFKMACPTYLMMHKGTPCEACVGGSVFNAVRRRCNGGSLMASAVSAAEATLHTRTGAYDHIARFICPSRFLMGRMEAAGFYPERLVHLPNFVASGPGPLRAEPGAGVIFASRLSDEKGVDVAIRAVAARPALRLEIAGDGPERSSLEELAEDLAPDRIRFLGHLPRPELLDALASARAAIVPSRCYENQPYAVLEAFSQGVPVVGSDLGGISELVDHAHDGYLVAAGDVAGFADALQALEDAPAEALRMGRRGAEKVGRHLGVTRHLTDLDAVYDDVGRMSVGVIG